MTDVLYIGGASRSGTTLLERLIGRLPDTQTLGEVRHLWSRGILDNQLCGCGTPFRECAFWSGVGSRAFGGWSAELGRAMSLIQERQDRSRRIPALAANHLRGTSSADVRDHAATYGRLYAAAAEESGQRIVIDSSKHVSQPFVLLSDPGINLRIVHVVRDPRGVAHSWSKQVVRPEITGETQLMDRLSARQVALDWDVQNAPFALAQRLGIPRLVVRYEDLLAAPAVAMAVVARFMGVALTDSYRGELTRRVVSLSKVHSAAGNPMRFRTGPVELRADEAWQREMSRHDRRVVSLLTGPLVAGYRRKLR